LTGCGVNRIIIQMNRNRLAIFVLFFWALSLLLCLSYAFAQSEEQAVNDEVATPPISSPRLSGSMSSSPEDQEAVPSQLLAPVGQTEAQPVLVQPEENKIVKSIEIQGNKIITVPTILAKIKTRVGEAYLQNVISDDLKRLYNTGYFSDVSIDHKDYEGGFKVIFYLVEKPIIEKVTFTKTRYFNPGAFLTKIQTKEGKFLDQKALKDDIATIKDMYEKKGLTTVSVDVETDIDKTTNKAKLHFIIEEGYRIKITKIAIEGNKTYSYKKMIRVIKTRASSLFDSGYLKEDVLAEDMERIKSFYEREGFIDVTADYQIDEGVKGRITVHIQIQEGNRYYTGKIVVNGNKVATEKEILDIMKEIKPGKVFSRERLSVDLANIRTLYFDKGYIFANANESTLLNPETGKVDVTLTVEEGDLAYVNKIKIQGNDRTRDIVIRRELRINPGDRFDGEKLRRSKERLRNLGYFEDINYDVEDTSVPNKKDLVVQLKETKTGSLSFGGGYSTVDQLIGFVEIEQKNFDFANWPTFTGGGQDLSVRGELGSVRNNMRLSFTEPWLFDYPVSGGFDAYRSKRLRESDVGYGYDEQRTGGDIRFGKELTEYISAGATYRLERIEISNITSDATNDLIKEEGTNDVSSVNLRIARDTRDNAFNPTKGLFLAGITDVAGGFLGGDKDFARLQGKGTYDIPLLFNSVLEFRVHGGIINSYGDSDGVPIFERFFTGGAYSIRGYNERKVGPLDPVTNDPIGGNSLLVTNIEYTVPLIDVIKLAAFFDSGGVWSKVRDFGQGDFKSGMGLGLRVKTPIGPINLDYGYPLNDEPGEESRSGKFYFSVSRGF